MNSVSKQLGVSRFAVREWRDRKDPVGGEDSHCVRCRSTPGSPPSPDYAHLLGLYLGDGCISPHRKGVFALRIACCDDYPRLMDECEASIRAVHPGKIFRVGQTGCTSITSLWKHWPCLFPQHGAGRKHERAIVLAPWQRDIVTRHPGALLRGLIHSDGCRVTNWATRTKNGTTKRYEYPRYFFTNVSADILGLCCWALQLLDIAHTHPTRRDISIARKASVARLDEFVGPKS